MNPKIMLISITKQLREPNVVLDEIVNKIELNRKTCDKLKTIAAKIIIKRMTKTFIINDDKEYLFNLNLEDFDELDVKIFKLYLVQELISYYKFNIIGFFEIE